MSIRQYRIVVCGNAGSGKSAWVKRLINDGFDPKYIATFGVLGDIIRFDTSYGIIFINFWDIGDMSDNNPSPRDNYLWKADACIVIVDGSEQDADTSSYYLWYRLFRCRNKGPVVAAKTKCDILQNPRLLTDIPTMSSKTGENIKLPIVEALRKLTGHNDLELIEKKSI